MYFGYSCDFRCAREMDEIRAAWNATGPFEWKTFDNDEYGVYLVTRVPESNLRIRLLGPAQEYLLTIDFDVERQLVRKTKSQLFSIMFKKLLPAIGATEIRDTSWETTPWPSRWFRRLVYRLRWG
jgi:hypothetical protein